ncbi:MAG: outer membrane beta-barrel protein [Saprospiraceae bacterium]|nr:outer membrane beta-barrel protein [Saprospiraceae bacterium]
MKKNAWLSVVLMFWTFIGFAQSSLTIDASQLLSNFKFKDSQGEKLNKEYNGIYTGAYRISYRYDFDMGLMLRIGVGMRNAGSTLSYDGSQYSWNLKYLEENLGIGYKYKLGHVSPYLMVSFYLAQMLQGSQVLNNNHFNIIEEESMKTSDLGLIFSPGAEIVLTDDMSAYVSFDYLLGLGNLEKTTDQKSSNTALGLTLGLQFKF